MGETVNEKPTTPKPKFAPVGDKSTREHNIGTSDYSKHGIQPWDIFLAYPELNYWDCDIIKRILRTKQGDTRRLDYEKIIHIAQERIRQIDEGI